MYYTPIWILASVLRRIIDILNNQAVVRRGAFDKGVWQKKFIDRLLNFPELPTSVKQYARFCRQAKWLSSSQMIAYSFCKSGGDTSQTPFNNCYCTIIIPSVLNPNRFFLRSLTQQVDPFIESMQHKVSFTDQVLEVIFTLILFKYPNSLLSLTSCIISMFNILSSPIWPWYPLSCIEVYNQLNLIQLPLFL